MATTALNLNAAVAQLDVALAAVQAAKAALHAEHVERTACGQQAASAETHAALSALGKFTHLDEANLAGQELLLWAQLEDVAAADLEEAVKRLHAKLAALEAALTRLAAARKALDDVIKGATDAAKVTCHSLGELLKAKTAPAPKK